MGFRINDDVQLTRTTKVNVLRVSAEHTFILPISAGTTGQVLTTAGDGNSLTWTTAATGTVTSVQISAGAGLVRTGGPITSSGTIDLSLTGQALALHNLGTSGIIVRTGAGTVEARSLTGGAGVSVTNGDGVADNPTITAQVGASALGGGQSIIIGTSATETRYRTFTGGGGIQVTTVGDTINVSAPPAPGQVPITASAKGGGSVIIQAIDNGVEIVQRTIVGGGIVDVTQQTDTITISAADRTPTFTTTNLGGSQQVALTVSANRDFRFRTISGAGTIDVRTSGNEIVISAPPAPGQVPITTSAKGDGENPVIEVSGGSEIIFKSFKGSGGVEVFTSSNVIKVSAAPTDDNFVVNQIATISAAGNNQGTASLINFSTVVVTGGTATQGIVLPVPALAAAGAEILVINNSGNDILLYPDSGQQIESLGVNTPYTINNTVRIKMIRIPGNNWVGIGYWSI